MRLYLISFIVISVSLACKNQSQQTENLQPNHKDVSITEAKNIIQSGAVKVIDVRTPSEIADGKISGALEIDFKASNFEQRLTSMDKDVAYLIYCRSGGRSAKAAKIMSKAGFKNVSNMLGGYSAWYDE